MNLILLVILLFIIGILIWTLFGGTGEAIKKISSDEEDQPPEKLFRRRSADKEIEEESKQQESQEKKGRRRSDADSRRKSDHEPDEADAHFELPYEVDDIVPETSRARVYKQTLKNAELYAEKGDFTTAISLYEGVQTRINDAEIKSKIQANIDYLNNFKQIKEDERKRKEEAPSKQLPKMSNVKFNIDGEIPETINIGVIDADKGISAEKIVEKATQKLQNEIYYLNRKLDDVASQKLSQLPISEKITETEIITEKRSNIDSTRRAPDQTDRRNDWEERRSGDIPDQRSQQQDDRRASSEPERRSSGQPDRRSVVEDVVIYENDRRSPDTQDRRSDSQSDRRASGQPDRRSEVADGVEYENDRRSPDTQDRRSDSQSDRRASDKPDRRSEVADKVLYENDRRSPDIQDRRSDSQLDRRTSDQPDRRSSPQSERRMEPTKEIIKEIQVETEKRIADQSDRRSVPDSDRREPVEIISQPQITLPQQYEIPEQFEKPPAVTEAKYSAQPPVQPITIDPKPILDLLDKLPKTTAQEPKKIRDPDKSSGIPYGAPSGPPPGTPYDSRKSEELKSIKEKHEEDEDEFDLLAKYGQEPDPDKLSDEEIFEKILKDDDEHYDEGSFEILGDKKADDEFDVFNKEYEDKVKDEENFYKNFLKSNRMKKKELPILKVSYDFTKLPDQMSLSREKNIMEYSFYKYKPMLERAHEFIKKRKVRDAINYYKVVLSQNIPPEFKAMLKTNINDLTDYLERYLSAD